jgi:hypothetical protein
VPLREYLKNLGLVERRAHGTRLVWSIVLAEQA